MQGNWGKKKKAKKKQKWINCRNTGEKRSIPVCKANTWVFLPHSMPSGSSSRAASTHHSVAWEEKDSSLGKRKAGMTREF